MTGTLVILLLGIYLFTSRDLICLGFDRPVSQLCQLPAYISIWNHGIHINGMSTVAAVEVEHEGDSRESRFLWLIGGGSSR